MILKVYHAHLWQLDAMECDATYIKERINSHMSVKSENILRNNLHGERRRTSQTFTVTGNTPTDADLRALLSELQTSGPVGLAIFDSTMLQFARVWYKEVGTTASLLCVYAQNEPFGLDLQKFWQGMYNVGNGHEVGTAKAGSNLRTKAMMQGVLALWKPLLTPLVEYQKTLTKKYNELKAKETAKPSTKDYDEWRAHGKAVSLVNDARGELAYILHEMKKWSEKYANGGGVW